MHTIYKLGTAEKDHRGQWVAKTVITFPDVPNRRLTIRTGKDSRGNLVSRALVSHIVAGMEITEVFGDYNEIVDMITGKRITAPLVNYLHAAAISGPSRERLETRVRDYYRGKDDAKAAAEARRAA